MGFHRRIMTFPKIVSSLTAKSYRGFGASGILQPPSMIACFGIGR